MSMRIGSWVVPVLAGSMAACTPGKATDTGSASAALDTAGLGQARADFTSAVGRNDANLLATFYADSAIFLAPGLATLRGRPAIEGLLHQALLTTHFDSFAFGPLAMTSRPGLVSEVGWQRDVSHQSGRPAQVAYGRYVITWVRSPGGKWQMALDATVVDSTRPAR